MTASIHNPKIARRPRIAAVGTVYRKYSHLQNILDRFLEGYGWGGVYHPSSVDVVSLYVDQRGADDITQERLNRHPMMKLYPTVAEAVTLGTSSLAVDGVIVVGEHGMYPLSPNGIMMHPHWEFFDQITQVFRSSGRSVPYFNDKELSWNWEWCKKMVDTAQDLGFPLQGGSSLTVCYRQPSVDMPLAAKIKEAVCIAYGDIASYDFHALETIQCMVERRMGGETGVKWLQTYRDNDFWEAWRQELWSPALFKAALCRSASMVPVALGMTRAYPTIEQLQTIVPNPVAYHYQYRDGLRCTIFLMTGLVRDFTFAASVEGQAKPLSTLMFLADAGHVTTIPSQFSPLVHHAEQLFLTGEAQYPIERTLLTSGLLIAGIDSGLEHRRVETPHLAAVNYQPHAESTFWRV